MYTTIARYLKNNNISVENTVFDASDITNEDKYLKAVFINNNTNNQAKISCYIKTNDNMNYYMFPRNLIVETGDSVSAIQKVLPLNNGDSVIFVSNVIGLECSLIIDYDKNS